MFRQLNTDCDFSGAPLYHPVPDGEYLARVTVYGCLGKTSRFQIEIVQRRWTPKPRVRYDASPARRCLCVPPSARSGRGVEASELLNERAEPAEIARISAQSPDGNAVLRVLRCLRAKFPFRSTADRAGPHRGSRLRSGRPAPGAGGGAPGGGSP